MAPAPAGAIVRVRYDTDAVVEPGDVIETTTGRRYLVDEVRPVCRRHPGGPWRRLNLRCVVLGPGEVVEGAVVHPLFWYRRGI